MQLKMKKFYHSVVLDEEKCCGCTNCIKRCPTEAIRVRDGKAHIISERCIDCGECIRVCPHHAKRARADKFSKLKDFEYTIAIPAPALFGQFNNLDDLDVVLSGLRQIGFHMVYEVSRGAELVSQATRAMKKECTMPKPIISSACPAVVRLIQLRFPDLGKNLVPLIAPMEVTAKIAKEEAARITGLDKSKIGAFFITPCPAKVTEIKQPSISENKSYCDGAISISSIYPKLTKAMNNLKAVEPIAKSGIIGVSWATSGGESSAMLSDKYLAADGIEHVIRVLEDLEDEHIHDIDFIELNACSGGCVGGVLNVENPYIAQARIHRLRKYLPIYQNHIPNKIPSDMKWKGTPDNDSYVLSLDTDIYKAMNMMERMERIKKGLPGLDCGSCGAPSCAAMAEDIVRGHAKETECIFILKEKIQNAYQNLEEIL